jgi:hypothetical protein
MSDENKQTLDLTQLTPDQLKAMTKADAQKVKQDIMELFDTVIEEKAQEEYAQAREKIGQGVQFFREKVLPWIQTGAVIYLIFKICGVV